MGIFSKLWSAAPEERNLAQDASTERDITWNDWFWNLFYVDVVDPAIEKAELEAEKLRIEEKVRICEAHLAEIIKKENNEQCSDVEETMETHQAVGCCLRTGVISDLHGDSGIIDSKLPFDRHNAPTNIRLNQFVSYLAYRASEDLDWVVRKILPSEDQVWEGEGGKQNDILEEPSRQADVQKEVLYRSELVKVTNRKGREIIVNDGKFQFNLDKVSAPFTPVVGDFLYLDAVVERDDQVADLGGAILDVERIRWVRYEVVTGVVTVMAYASGEGRVGTNIFFNKDVCKPGYVPCRGDSVTVEAIESYQGQCTWRALMVAPVQNLSKNVRLNTNATAVEIRELCQPKHGIAVNTNELDFGKVLMKEEGKIVTVKLKNTGGERQLLMYGDFHSTVRDCQVSAVRPVQKVDLFPGQTLEYSFRCVGKFMGMSRELFVFCFKGFKVGFYFSVDVYDPECLSMVSTENTNTRGGKYSHPACLNSIKGKVVVRGERPLIPPKFIAVRRDRFTVPERFWNAVLDEKSLLKPLPDIKECLHLISPSLGTYLTYQNYREFFHTLLYLEEMENILRIQEYDMTTVLFQRAGDFMSLDVPGLAEKRPSLLVGDKVLASQPWKNDRLVFEGFIHKTFAKKVWIKFNCEFHSNYSQEVCNVSFQFGHTPIQRQHNAVEDAMDHLGETILFPTKLVLQPPQVELDEDLTGSVDIVANLYSIPDPTKRTITWVNQQLNHYQKEAVRNVLKGEARPLPYIVFGPPGTGKTVTLVETILQILFLLPNSRLLVATPSNSSANLISERLLDSDLLKPGDLVRLVGYHVLEEGTLPEKLRPYATTGSVAEARGTDAEEKAGEMRDSSNRSTLGRHRITVGTCIALGQLVHMGFPQGHFTHVVIDEAGQATEPEIHVPLGFLDRSGQAVLAGDPLQLGPVVCSSLAKTYGLGESYLDRLTSRTLYQRDPVGFPSTGGFDPRLVTRLVKNYRSLPEILALPNDLFYDSLLEPEVSSTEGPDAQLLRELGEFLPTRDERFGSPPPILFHGVVGMNLQEADSPSWFNPHETLIVFHYLKVAFACGLMPEDVGVITPYRKQVQKMRWYFNRMHMLLPKIGSVEEFQGQERRVIIMSAVRSKKEFLEMDVIHSLGFVASPKRLNVAITRARSLLVIVGNPHLLATDPYWRSVIRYCVERQCYTGCEAPLNCLDGRDLSEGGADRSLSPLSSPEVQRRGEGGADKSLSPQRRGERGTYEGEMEDW